jgi:hypothetical protein
MNIYLFFICFFYKAFYFFLIFFLFLYFFYKEVRFSLDIMTKGCFNGSIRWLPLGMASAVFYASEPQLRYLFQKNASSTSIEKNKLPYASIASVSTAGAISGLVGSLIPYTLHWPGFREPSGVSALVIAGIIGASLLPRIEELEDIERKVFR